MNKILLAHPYRHHSYYSLQGIMQYTDEAYACYGYYDKGDVLDTIVKHSRVKDKVRGFSSETIDNSRIYTDERIKLLFLLAKFSPKYTNKYIDAFDKYVQKYIKDFDAVHFLQDYCNESIRAAYSNGKKIVYEQIQPFDTVQAEALSKEVEIAGFAKEYVGNRFPQSKIDKQIENLEMADVIIAASKVTEDSLRKYTSKKIYTFPYGAELTSCTENEFTYILERKLQSAVINVLYVGAINLIKGVRYIVECAKRLKNDPFRFTIVGRPSFEEDKKIIDEIKMLPNCNYIESVPHVRMNQLYQENDIFIFQGLCEGFGMVSLEAMSNGLPCLLSEGGCGIVSDGYDGLINENCDVDSILSHLFKLYNDRNLLVDMSRNARNSALNCSWGKFSNNVEEVYSTEFGVIR